MNETIDWQNIETGDLASLISEHLKKDKIETVLVGGSCVTIYSKNSYISRDLDYVAHEDFSKIRASLEKIGFVRKGRIFIHAECPFAIDFVTYPVTIGNEIITQFQELRGKYGVCKLLTPQDCVKDRLASYYHWDDRQNFNQALEIALAHKVNLGDIREWSKKEGHEKKFTDFFDALQERRSSRTSKSQI